MKPKRKFAACDNKALGKFIKRKYCETFGLVFLVIGNQITRLATIALRYWSAYLCGRCFAISIFDAKAPKVRLPPLFVDTSRQTRLYWQLCSRKLYVYGIIIVLSRWQASVSSYSANMRWLLTRDLWHRLMALLICLASSFTSILLGFDLLIIIAECRRDDKKFQLCRLATHFRRLVSFSQLSLDNLDISPIVRLNWAWIWENKSEIRFQRRCEQRRTGSMCRTA